MAGLVSRRTKLKLKPHSRRVIANSPLVGSTSTGLYSLCLDELITHVLTLVDSVSFVLRTSDNSEDCEYSYFVLCRKRDRYIYTSSNMLRDALIELIGKVDRGEFGKNNLEELSDYYNEEDTRI